MPPILVPFIIIGLIIYLAWEFLKAIWPVLIVLVVAGIIFFVVMSIISKINEEKKEKEKRIKSFEDNLARLEKEEKECVDSLKNNPDQIFIKSYLEQLPYEIELLKDKYTLSENSKGLSDVELEELNNRIKKNSEYLDKYLMTDITDTPNPLMASFIAFTTALDVIENSCAVWKVPSRVGDSFFYYWASNFNRSGLSFKKGLFNKVKPKDSCEIYYVTIGKNKYYFYPRFIIESKSPVQYKIYEWSMINPSLNSVTVVEKNKSIKGATNIGYTYEHTCLDGSPDMRYKYNAQYPKNQYGFIRIKNIDNFNIDIANFKLADNLFKALLNLKNNSNNVNTRQINKSNNSPSQNKTKDSRIAPLSNTNDYKTTCKEIDVFKETLESIIKNDGVHVLTQKRLIYMLDDYHVFYDAPYLKHILELMQTDGYMQKLLDNKDRNKASTLYPSQMSQKYMLQEDVVREVFNNIISILEKKDMGS